MHNNHHEHQQHQQLQQHQLQQLQQLHLENSVAAAVNGRSNTYFQMNRMQQCYAHNAGIDATQPQQQQMNSSFHGIQLQNHLPNNTGVERNDYRLQHQQQHQTATVHGEFWNELGGVGIEPFTLPFWRVALMGFVFTLATNFSVAVRFIKLF